MDAPEVTKTAKSHLHKHLERMEHTRKRALSVDWVKLFRALPKSEEKLHTGFEEYLKDEMQFMSGSKYRGTWNILGMTRYGNYTFHHKVDYTGKFNDGMFHGEGRFTYPNNHKVDVYFQNDTLIEAQITLPDGLVYKEPWQYCVMPDRRFYSEVTDGFNAACFESLTNEEKPRKIPKGCYDAGEGFYNPVTHCIVSVDDTSKVLRIPTLSEEEWIMDNCRKAWDEPIGYRPDLYEKWCTGRRAEGFSRTDDTTTRSN